jgi:CheY-like chemotaxis protein
VTGLGGTLTVDSELGKGSTFRVDLPATAPGTGTTVSGAKPIPPPQAAPRRGHILVVDDEPIVCFSLERLLTTEGDVVALTSAREALARIRAGERFDVILCDLLMPEMDAPALHAELLAVAPDQAERMVFVTGGAFTVRAREFLDRVPNERLAKPFDVDGLFSLVRRCMSAAPASK